MANTNTITFKIGDETRPVLETGNLHESIFSELYQKAFTEIDNYIGKIKEINADEKGGYNYEGVNNIFAFIGERGAGKTSCMMSVAKALEHKGENLSILNGLENIKQTTLLNSVLIDPSFFDQKNNILSLIIAHLFKTFRDQASKKDCKNDEEKRRTLIACFEKVQKNLNNLFPKDNSLSTDTLEGLVNFSAAIDLQKNIKALIDAYLNFMSNEEKAKFLVLMIDDIDLHTQHAREMVEQIRKYFIQPNVVVLMAVKIDQLSNVIKSGLSEEYKALIKNNEMSFELINEMVERYLGKLLPHSHRFYLSNASIYLKRTLTIKNDEEIVIGDKTVREAILQLIYEKTQYCFLNYSDIASYIIPTNLRELRHLITLLYNMGPDQDLNKQLFIDYFKNAYIRNCIDSKGVEMIMAIIEIQDYSIINKRIVDFLNTTYVKGNISSDDSSENRNDDDELHTVYVNYNSTMQIKEITNSENFPYNISLGDSMGILDYCIAKSSMDKDRKLLFGLKFALSVKIHEAINIDKESKETSECLTIKADKLSDYSNYSKILCSSYINPNIFRYLRNTNGNTDRQNIAIYPNKLTNDLFSTSATVDLFGLGYIDDLKKMSEFIALSLSSTYDSENTSNARRKAGLIYGKKLSRIDSKVSYDPLAVLVNVYDIEKAYKRLKNGDQLFEWAVSDKNSLLGEIFLELIKIDKPEMTKESFEMSLDVYKNNKMKLSERLIIRDIDILDLLKSYMLEKKEQYRGVDFAYYVEFYRTLFDFEVPFRDALNFKILLPIVRFLDLNKNLFRFNDLKQNPVTNGQPTASN